MSLSASAVAGVAAYFTIGCDNDDKYVCGLDAETEKKAIKELNEDPKDRLNAVQALRAWIRQQPHLTFRADTLTLLAFLRTAKFSQLIARQKIENYARSCTVNWQWMQDIDTHDPKLLQVIDSGYVLPLPRTDKNGSSVLLYRMGSTKPNGQLFSVTEEIRAAMIVGWYAGLDECVQVNGYVFVFDMTGVSAKQLTHWTLDDIKRWNSCWQNAMPGRFKSFNYYNAGAIFDAMMAVSRPFLTKKMQDRIRVHDTMESLYRTVDMECLPTEYLPDDYRGPSAGSIASIIENFKRDIMTSEFRAMCLDQTSKTSYGIDETKRPKYKAPNESFRKLTVN